MALIYTHKYQENIEQIIVNKTFSFLFSKFYFRTKFNSKVFIVDNNSTAVSTNSLNVRGFSCFISFISYEHKYNKNIKFIWFKKNSSKLDIGYFLQNFLKPHKSIILKPLRGGIMLYSGGFKGFLSLKELLPLLLQNSLFSNSVVSYVYIKYFFLTKKNYFINYILTGVKSISSLQLSTRHNISKKSNFWKIKKNIIIIYKLQYEKKNN